MVKLVLEWAEGGPLGGTLDTAGNREEEIDMIKITRLNDTVVVVSADMIEFLEATPDTIITLTDGRKVIAKESVDEVIQKVVEYKQLCFSTGPQVHNRKE